MSASGAFHGDPAIKAALLARLDRHLAAGTLVPGDTAWDGTRGSAMGVSIKGTDPADYAAAYGYPLPLAALLDPVIANLAAGFDAGAFVRDWVAVVRPGADLSRVPADLMLHMLGDPSLRRADAALAADLTALHRRTGDDPPPAAAWRAVRRRILGLTGAGPGDGAVDLLEAAAWPVAGARSTLTSAFAAWRRMQALSADPDWSIRDEARKTALLDAIWEEEAPARAAGADVNYHERLVARDADLARRFLLNLNRTNDAVLGAAGRLTQICIALLGAAPGAREHGGR